MITSAISVLGFVIACKTTAILVVSPEHQNFIVSLDKNIYKNEDVAKIFQILNDDSDII